MRAQDSARGSWDALDEPWRVAIEAAWQAYREGGIAVGAVLTDADGAIIGAGRNQRFSGQTPGLLAHAEMEALAAIPPDKQRARDAVLYTTLSPCPMCLGAIVVARVGQVHIGAVDPTWQGIEKLPGLNDEVARRWPRIHGPLPGPPGVWLAIAPCLNSSGALLRAMKATAPTYAALARAVDLRYRTSTRLPSTAVEAWESAWDLISAETRDGTDPLLPDNPSTSSPRNAMNG